MTLAVAKQEVAKLGLTLVKNNEYGEYIVKPRGATKDHPHAYFTNDLDDAVGTARAMARESQRQDEKRGLYVEHQDIAN